MDLSGRDSEGLARAAAGERDSPSVSLVFDGHDDFGLAWGQIERFAESHEVRADGPQLDFPALND